MHQKLFDNKIHLVCFIDGPIYNVMKDKIIKTYNSIGEIDTIDIWNKARIKKSSFYEKNSKTFKVLRGFGLWAWKPYIIYELLKKVNDNDFVIYIDLSSHHNVGFEQSVVPLLNYLHQEDLIIPGVHLFTEDYKIKYWTHDITYKVAKEDGTDMYKYCNMCLTSPLIFRKNNLSLNFVKLWLNYCSTYKYIQNKEIKEKSLKIPQSEQSILSILISKFKLKAPSPTGPFPDNYTTNKNEIDIKNNKFSYVRLLRNFNYLFKLFEMNEIPEFV